ncbi:OPT oligopeptide transporter protein [Rhizoctonia solani]|uniref:OPT oligopeptide transporter protein n=1 Tax=Rhizoctonia solani TaxID=456999 RepID=A0A8H7IN53_9AGAM|nr:OPT oligopeptide transporter protein [Rhizoctonia solani]
MEEATFVKSHVAALSGLPTTYPNTFEPAPEDFSRKLPVVPIEIPPPPERKNAQPSASGQINVTVKSLKPALAFPLVVLPTDSIASIKEQLAQHSRAPPADAQRLLLKGKALADNKLLQEYDIGDGATINLLIKPGVEWTGIERPMATLSEKSPSHLRLPSQENIPSVVLSPIPDPEGRAPSPHALALDAPPPPISSSVRQSYHQTISNPAFWDKMQAFLSAEFSNREDADNAFEAFLIASKEQLTAGEIAKIRDATGNLDRQLGDPLDHVLRCTICYLQLPADVFGKLSPQGCRLPPMATQQPELSGIAPEGSRSVPSSPRDEKTPSFDEKKDNEKSLGVHDSDHGHTDSHEPFPIDPEHADEEYQLTLRALVVGWMLGAVVGASNIYLGLKTGFTFGPQLFGAIFGFAILKPLSKAFTLQFLPGWVWGGEFGPKENCTVQTAATSAGGMGIIFVSAVPAMYRMGLMSEFPDADVGRRVDALIALTVSAAFFGEAHVPYPTATAFTIRALHAGRTGAEAARKKSIGLASSFGVAFCFKVAAGYLPGIIWDWHIGWTFYRLGWTNMIELDNFGWWPEFTPAFFGAGMLSGMNASWSFFGGFVLAWGIIAPSLISTGGAVGKQRSPDEFPEVWSYQAMSFKTLDEYVHSPSPRYWLLWPGVLIMLVYSFAEMFMSSRAAFKSFGKLGPAIVNNIRRLRTRGDPNTIHTRRGQRSHSHRVPAWAWGTGLILSLIMSCALLATQFSLNVGEVILALVFRLHDINPVSTVAKASQLIFGGVTKGTGAELKPAQEINLVAGIIAAGSAAQACDMTGDLKTGHLLRAKPKNQFVAQVTGSIVSVFLGVGLFVLFTKASPCILYPPEDGICSYGAPSVAAWQAVATAVTADKLPIPPSSGYTAIGLSIAAVITVVIKHLWIPRKYWGYIPNWNAIGLAFVVPQTYYGTAMAAGATFNYLWERRNPRSFDMYMFPISAGMLAGEGLGGVLLALLSVAGVGADGVKYGTSVGCTINEFCG